MVASPTLQVAKEPTLKCKGQLIPSFITTLKNEFMFLTLYFPSRVGYMGGKSQYPNRTNSAITLIYPKRTSFPDSPVHNLSKTLPKLSITCWKVAAACSKLFPSIANCKIIYRRSFEQFEQPVDNVHNPWELSTGGVDNFKPTLSRFNIWLGICLCYRWVIR